MIPKKLYARELDIDIILDEHETWFIYAAIALQSAYWDADWESKGLGKL